MFTPYDRISFESKMKEGGKREGWKKEALLAARGRIDFWRRKKGRRVQNQHPPIFLLLRKKGGKRGKRKHSLMHHESPRKKEKEKTGFLSFIKNHHFRPLK